MNGQPIVCGYLSAAVATFERWLYLPDPGALYATLGAVAANHLPGNAVWILLVGPPGGGKSEIIISLNGLPNVHPAATITEAALLSATPQREKTSGAHGGLLRQIGDFGIIAAKDFGSVLSMRGESRTATLAALREVYDGAWTRLMGTDGGKTYSWSGKVGFVAGCTPTIDRHHAVMGAMGERFLLYRLPETDPTAAARGALRHAGREREMQVELAAAVGQVLASRAQPRPTTEAERELLVSLAELAARSRSAVERDSYSREIELIPDSEVPTRLVLQLERLLAGLDSIGASRDDAWRVVRKAALDSIPASRFAVMVKLRASEEPIGMPRIAGEIGYPDSTAKRALEDLAAHGIAVRATDAAGTRAAAWTLTRRARKLWAACDSEIDATPISLSRALESISERQGAAVVSDNGPGSGPEGVPGA